VTSIPSFFTAIILSSLVVVCPASATITYVGSTTGTNGAGDTLKAQVTMFLPGETDSFGHTCTGPVGTLCMTLDNSQVGGTQTRGDVLASLYFSVAGNPVLLAASAVADSVLRPTSASTPVLSVAPQSAVLSGGWALVTTPGTDTVNASLPTSGYAWATVGNSGAISNGTYNVGSDDYSIISGTNVGVIGGGITVISNELFLTLTGFKSGSSSLALSAISNVIFGWNSTGQFSANGTVVAPEPATAGFIAIALMGILVGGKALRRHKPQA
jgi:hypothetical protein